MSLTRLIQLIFRIACHRTDEAKILTRRTLRLRMYQRTLLALRFNSSMFTDTFQHVIAEAIEQAVDRTNLAAGGGAADQFLSVQVRDMNVALPLPRYRYSSLAGRCLRCVRSADLDRPHAQRT